MTKRRKILYILLAILTGCLVFDLSSLEKVLCESYACRETSTSSVFWLFSTTILSLFFVLVSIPFKEKVFEAWWKFARFAIPIVLLISFVISLGLHHNPGGWFNVDNDMDIARVSVLYIIFILGSAWQMYRGFRAKE